jgi:hypothetical protein
MRIRVQIQGFDDRKLEEITAEIKFIFFLSKIAIYLSVGLYEERPSYRRSLHPSKAVAIHDILVWIQIRGSMSLTNGSGSGFGSGSRSLYFHHCPSRCQQKTNLKKSFSAYYFLKVLLHHFSKITSQKEVTKQ